MCRTPYEPENLMKTLVENRKMRKWKLGRIEFKKVTDSIELPDEAVPFKVELPQSYVGDDRRQKPTVEFPGSVYFIAPWKETE